MRRFYARKIKIANGAQLNNGHLNAVATHIGTDMFNKLI